VDAEGEKTCFLTLIHRYFTACGVPSLNNPLLTAISVNQQTSTPISIPSKTSLPSQTPAPT
jgi:hypothetical protein